MTDKVKFHFLASLLNIFLIFLLMNLHEYVIEKYIDSHAFFARMGAYFYKIYALSLFIISWVAPFSIYKFKNYKKHFYLFLSFFLLVIILLIGYNILLHITSYKEYYNDISHYIIERSIFIGIKEETLIASFFISTLIYFSQMIIGKKLLPTLYK